MVPIIEDIMKLVRNKGLVNIYGKINHFTKDSGIIMNLMVEVFTHGLMEDNMMENGRIVKCMGLESTLGKMVESTKDSTLTIKKKVKDYIPGLTVEHIMVSGKVVNNMEWVLILATKEIVNKVYGKTAKRSSGWIMKMNNDRILESRNTQFLKINK